MVRCLLEEGANASAVDARGMTPIAHAAQGGNLLAVRALLKAKATGGSGRLVNRCCGCCASCVDYWLAACCFAARVSVVMV